jgi:hypothetical protein
MLFFAENSRVKHTTAIKHDIIITLCIWISAGVFPEQERYNPAGFDLGLAKGEIECRFMAGIFNSFHHFTPAIGKGLISHAETLQCSGSNSITLAGRMQGNTTRGHFNHRRRCKT